ncbi:MAG: GNAT family protein [Chloroflexota bacterium]
MQIHPVTLTGHFVRLEPMSEAHLPDFLSVGLDDAIWRYMLYGDIHTEQDLRAWVLDILARQARGTDLPFAVIDLESRRAIGATRYLNIQPEHRNLEIGGTWYATEFQGSGVNADAKYLLLRHAFESLGCLRVQFKTDSRNLRSQHAIRRLGAVQEGVLRKHMILPDGLVRDSIYYSIIDDEWPAVKAGLEARLEGYAAAARRSAS